MTNTTEYTQYAQFNTFTVTGRITNSEIVNGRNGEFLSVTMVSQLKTDAHQVSVVFTDNGQLLKLAKFDKLMAGRIITAVGRILKISEVYEDKNGTLQMRKRPQVQLTDVIIPSGGLGLMPKNDRAELKPANAVKRIARRPEQPAADSTDFAPVDQAPSWTA